MSSPVLSASRRRAFFLAPILIAGLSLLSCGREVTGPEGGLRTAAFAFDPQMPTAFAVEGSGSVVPFSRVRVTLRELGGAFVDAEVVEFPSDAQSVELSMEVQLPFGAGNEGIPLLLDMQYINAAGDTVFRAGPQTVTAVPATAGEQPPVVPVEVTYVGTGANAQTVVISQQPGTVLSGTSTTFNASALDGQGQPIANTPVVFSSPDPAHVSITPLGVATWLPVRGPARIVATLPTGVDADTVTMTVALPATQLEIVSGNGQSGNAGQTLENDIMLRVLASDDVPVSGVTVTFTVATGGGSLSEETAVSDEEGFVATEWTLGGAPGVQTLTATFPGLIGGPVTISANSGAGPATTLAIASGDGQQGSPGQALPLPISVRVTDEFGNGVAGITVFWATLSEIGSVTPTQSTTDATGHASAQWTLGASVGVQQARATVAELQQSVDFSATAVSAGVATWTGAVSNDWNLPGNWDIGAVPAATDHVVIPNVGQNPYPRLTSSAVVVGSVDVQAGSLWLDGQAMIVAGNFSTSGSGVLVMQEDNAQLHVGGNATFGGGSTSGLLTLGVLSVAGNFTQVGTNSPESFQAGPDFSTLLQAPSPTVSFTDPGASGQTSRFGDLIWSGTGTLTQQSGITVLGAYATTSTTPITHLGIGGAEGRYVEFAEWVSFGPVTFDNVRVLVRQTPDDAVSVSIANISFQNLPAAATQLNVLHPGAGSTVTLDNVAFQVTPATTLYLSATDMDTDDGQPLVVNVANATPTTPGGGVATFGGAIVNWPAASQRTWVGSASSDWHDPANWFPAAVPGTLDEVLIGTATNPPIISAPATIGNLIVTFGGTLTLTNTILTVNGDITVDGAIVADPGTSEFRASGTGRTIRGTNIQHVDVRGVYTQSGPLGITGDLFVRGSINPDANTLTIGGNLNLLSAGVLVMQSTDDHVIVGGNAFFTGGATEGLLTAGILELHGNLTQANSGTGFPSNSFAPSGTHTTRLVGSGTQALDIFNSGRGPGFSHFASLDLSQQTGTVNLTRFNTMYVDGVLISHGTGTGATLTTGDGARLDAFSTDVSRLRLSGVPLTIGAGSVIDFSGVTFLTYPGNVTQLTVAGPGIAAPIVLSGLTFNSVPAPNNYYIEASDTDGPTPNALTVHVTGSTPATPAPTLFNALNGAVIGWPPAAGARIWEGDVNGSWSEPGNWVGNTVPTATDSVHIPGGTPNSPFVDESSEVRTLTLAAGATLTPGFNLTVRGSVDVAPGAAIESSDGLLRLMNETGGTISGALANVQIQGGLFTLDGITSITGSLEISGQEFTPGVPVLGDVSVGNFDLTVSGGLVTGPLGRLTMMGTGVVAVANHVNFFGASTAGRLTNGTLRVGGEFFQSDTESPESFSASGAHLVELTGTNRIVFDTPLQSNFHNVDFVTPGATRTFHSDVRATGLVRLPAANVTLASSFGVGAGNAWALQAARVETFGAGITFSNIAITTTAFQSHFGGSVTFADFDPTLIQLDITGDAAANGSMLNATSFLTTPTGLGRFVRIADVNGSADGSPNLTVSNPTPATHGGWVEVVAPATMTGWPANPAVVFTGARDNTWNIDDNWSTGRVPEPTDSVIIPADLSLGIAFPTTPLTLRALVMEYQGFVNLGTQLTITGTLVAPTGGNFTCDGGTIVFAGGAVDPVQAQGILPCLTRIVSGSLLPSGTLRVQNDLQVEVDARLFPARSTVTVTGNFSTMGAATLQMTEATDSLIVLGGATFAGASTEGLLRDGVLVINGNFEQRGPGSGASASSFAASDNHLTVFAGFGLSQVSFETPGNGAGTSHFAHVQAAKGEGGTPVQLDTRVFANGQLRSTGQQSQLFSGARGDGSEAFESWGADVANFQFGNVTWRIVDGAAVGAMEAITFSGMDLAATQLDIERSGGDITIRGIQFLTTPEQGLFLRAADSNEGDGQELVITVDSPTPSEHGGRILEEFGARIAGWALGVGG